MLRQPQRDDMKLLSWNTAYGRGTAAAIELADRVGADVLMLQEGQPGDLWRGKAVGARVVDHAWGSWVLTRSGSLEPIAITGYSGWVSGARWWRYGADVDEPLYLFSVHSPTPSRNEPRATYVAESRSIVATICACVPTTAPLLIGGDFNFRSLGQRLPSETIQTEHAELEALQEFRGHGLSVAWQDCHRGEPLCQTLRWVKDPAVPYHCDGFLTRNLELAHVRCDVLLPESDVPHSDHNAILLKILGKPQGRRGNADRPTRDAADAVHRLAMVVRCFGRHEQTTMPNRQLGGFSPDSVRLRYSVPPVMLFPFPPRSPCITPRPLHPPGTRAAYAPLVPHARRSSCTARTGRRWRARACASGAHPSASVTSARSRARP